MRIYLAGGVSANLNPAWKYMAKKEQITEDGFIEGLKNENFWQGGESRHWIQDLASPIKENENFSSRNERDNRECNCSWRGSLHGGVGGVRPYNPQA